MFYTKYRPQRFEDVVGLEPIRKSLLSSLKKRRVGHAYLFAGPRGTGKTTMARLLAKALNCQQVDSPDWGGNPCGVCDPCRAIEAGHFLDLIEIDAASNRGIDDIRGIREKVGLAPSGGRKKVYIIDEVHMLTLQAFNALLKTLEEPPDHAVFILATTEPDKVPDTIRSRCQQFEFKRAQDSEIKEKLRRICLEEKVEVTDETLMTIAKTARGGFRDAENILEQVVVGEGSLEDLVGYSGLGAIADLVGWLLEKDMEKSLTFLDHFYQNGGSLPRLVSQCVAYFRDLVLIKAGVGEELVAAASDDYQKMCAQASSGALAELRSWLEEFAKAERDLPLAPIPTLPVELAVVRGCSSKVCEDGKHCGESALSAADLAQNRSGSTIEFEAVTERWGEILRVLRSFNHSLEALLHSVRPKDISDGCLILEAAYPFHLERVSEIKNLRMIEKAAVGVLGFPLKVRCVLGEKTLPSAAPGGSAEASVSAAAVTEKEAAEAFSGL